MAKKRKTTRRAKAKTIYKRSRGGGGKWKDVLDGALAGVGSEIANKYVGNIPILDDAIVTGVGIWRKNSTLKTMGGYMLGKDLGSLFTGKMATSSLFVSQG